MNSTSTPPAPHPLHTIYQDHHRWLVQLLRRKLGNVEQAYLDALASQPEATSQSPETVAMVVEAMSTISRVLEGLPARTREIFLLSQLDGMKYVDIARQLDVSVNVVQKAMVKGFQHCYQAVYSADAS